MKHHRACLRCGLVKCFNQFYRDGCENCPFLELAERQDRVQSRAARAESSAFESIHVLAVAPPRRVSVE